MTEPLEIAELVVEEKALSLLENKDPAPVRSAIRRLRKGPRDLALLLSSGADGLLEEMAQHARKVTFARFGRVVSLYAPLYTSNYCIGLCPYCGFRKDRDVPRRDLSVQEILDEANCILKMGIKHLLLVCGEDPKRFDMNLLAQTVGLLKKRVQSVSVEIPPLSQEDYSTLVHAGVDGVTLYQETFDLENYGKFHGKGPKADFNYRLNALNRAGDAGMRILTTGALWGLSPWRLEGLRLGVYAEKLQQKHWESSVSIGLPRLHDVPEDFEIPHPVSDRSLAHLIVALRIFMPDVGLVLSTRERPDLREQLVPLGITQMSAGSRTEPGGYSLPGEAADQFAVSDHRIPTEVAEALSNLGYDPVFKDWSRAYGG